ncbi:hypothetical protein YC2023_086997 [Brassica napus]
MITVSLSPSIVSLWKSLTFFLTLLIISSNFSFDSIFADLVVAFSFSADTL